MKINHSQSLYLDLLRGFSAVAVVFHHYSGHIVNIGGEITAGRAFPNVGQEAVMVFFVLSGFIITFVANTKEKSLPLFMSKRMGRFFSVVIPSVLLIIGLYYITSAIEPGWYELHKKGSMEGGIVKTFATLLFINHNAFFAAELPAAGPFWSLVCEWWYYVIFSLFFFLPNRLIALLLGGVIIGFSSSLTLLLFPIWCTGVAAYYVVNRIQISSTTARWLAISGPILFVLLWASGLRYSVLNTEVLVGGYYAQATYFPYFWIQGVLLAAHLIGMMQLMRESSREWRAGPDRLVELSVRRLAHCSFLLYLVHLPIMLFFKAAFGGLVFPYFIPFATVILCIIIGPGIENLRFPAQKMALTFLTSVHTRMKRNRAARAILAAQLKM